MGSIVYDRAISKKENQKMSGEKQRQKQVEKNSNERTREVSAQNVGEQAVAGASPEAQKSAEELKNDIDSLLDEIDLVLEENAEEFVRSYLQQGGE